MSNINEKKTNKTKQKTKCVIQRPYWWLLDVGMAWEKSRKGIKVTNFQL